MRALQKFISERQNELRAHSLFELLETSSSLDGIACMARSLAWLPMVFQDVLRLNSARVQGRLQGVADFDRSESSGHDIWFLQDLRTLKQEPPSLEELFGPEYQPLRDACYSIIAEIHRSESDAQHVALLLALEPTGRLFFERVSAAVARIDSGLELRYFSRGHLTAENEYDLATETRLAQIERLALGEDERELCEAMVGRIYDAMSDVFTYLEGSVVRGSRFTSEVRSLTGDARELRAVGRVRGA